MPGHMCRASRMRWHFSQGANSRVCISRFKRQGPGVDVNCATDDADSPAASETQQRPTHFLTSHQQQAEEVDVSASRRLNSFLSPATRGMLLLNLGAALFGSNQVVIKTSEELMSPFTLNALRFSAAALCFLPLIPRAIRRVPIKPALELGLWLTAGYTFQAIGLSTTSASHGAFTGSFTVLTVPVLIGLSGIRISRTIWVSAAAALLGIGLLTGDGGPPNIGDAACVVSAVLFGVHTWRVEAIVESVKDSTGLAALQLVVLAGCSIAFAAPELFGLVSSQGVSGTFEVARGLPWGEVLFMGIGTTALSLYMEVEALKDVSAATAALIYTSEPIWGAALAWVALGERWGPQGWIGALLVIGASVYSQVSSDKDKLKLSAKM